MSKVISDMSMSLDGYVCGPDDSIDNPWGKGGAEVLHHWIFDNKTDKDEAILQEALDSAGAVIMGRWSYDKCVDAWGPDGPVPGVPCFVVTHKAPEPAPSAYIFVTDGVESAIRQAKAVAGGKNVALHGATVAQQALALELLDEILVHVVPVLLDDGTRLFEHLGGEHTLETVRVDSTPGATHIRLRVVR
jgi:dihydrofolate reductase